MKSLNKKNLLIYIVITCSFILCFSLVTFIQYKNYNRKFNIIIFEIVNDIKNNYPDYEEEKIIEILNKPNIDSISFSILNKYGIDQNETEFIIGMKEELKNNIILNAFIVFIFMIVLLVIYIINKHRLNNRLDNILKYVQEINNKNYDLHIKTMNESYLSKLETELYKITVTLKEQAIISENEKESIKIAVSDISHQIKTPLTSISILLDNLKENSDMDEKIRKDFINEIGIQIDRIKSLVISLLKLARFDAGVIVFNNDNINVLELLNNVVKNVSILLEINNIEVNINGDKSVSFIGDYKWQLEAITNILKNCIEHSSNSNIDINFEYNNLYTKIIIKDYGEGIDKEDLKNIFKRFYKCKNSKSDSIGIGLSLTKSIIDNSNGNIVVKSKVGEGTTFIIKYFNV
ncbi:MAG: HAMP domain-containing histidine kinase [Clostridium sp.]|nr:HAMP domain-containing histidine kinase [Clostridium sp.]MCM1444420.1 HAMP domain-containing histidine kinase [Candidatus Amulumruptor caecigallinarius]